MCVTINLNGFEISGGGSGRGVRAPSANSVTVENGSITNFGEAVDLGEAATVTGLRADDNQEDAILVGAASLVQNSTASFNGGTGIETDRFNCVISNNTANNNSGEGILAGNGSSVTHNAASDIKVTALLRR